MDSNKDFTDNLQDMFDNMENDTLLDIFSFTNHSHKTLNFKNLKEHRYGASGAALLLVSFSILVIISFFGNMLVVHVVVKNRKMHTVTYIFIANMAFSDLLMTCLNVPLNIARELMSEWTLGSILCHLLNFSLMTSVYVSTFTLTAIALDRQRVLIYPLNPRITKRKGIFILVLIWTLAFSLSLPYGVYTRVQDLNLFVMTVKRCRTYFPSEKLEQYLTIATVVIQYVIPLSIIGVTYGRIVHKLWLRTQLGVVTEKQRVLQIQEKRKSIKLLVAVVAVFAICWMPLNLYHLLTDLHPNAKQFSYNSTVFFICHWVAISSTCINPFLYCWMNPIFKREFKNILKCCCAAQSHPVSSRSFDMEFDDLISPSNDRGRMRYRMQFTNGRGCSNACSNMCSVSSSDSQRGETHMLYSNRNSNAHSQSV
ncbi:G-protein coupled receptor 83-like [Argopecten irradians]|uniref:G-protein coupled receptor 83-like n=1 Tax=Argopecten irradians TaxID=31199 RepID=UPI00371477D5